MLIKHVQMNTIVSLLYFDVRRPGIQQGGCGWMIHDAEAWWAGWWGLPQPEDNCLQSPLLAGSDGLQDRQGVRPQIVLSKLSGLTQNSDA